ncbi:MAG TPA: amino acid adenylation domain-containing protein [Candidatus Dormibacteraeota bacterium]|nr:amino acid adenylation domain-containing protein [Candidatus Dormibacteraeota bacterium]
MELTTLQGFAISPQQERAWRSDQAGHSLGGLRAVVDVRGLPDPVQLGRAFDKTIQRHEILRTRLLQPAGMEAPIQVIQDSIGPIQLSGNTDLSPLQIDLRQLQPDHSELHIFIPATHGDVATLRVIMQDVAEFLSGADEDEGPCPQYADATEWQTRCLLSSDHATDRAYWANVATQAPPPELPFSRNPGQASNRDLQKFPVAIDAELWRGLTTLASKHGSSLARVAQAAWLAFFSRLNGLQALAVLHDGRRHPELRRLAGPLSKYLPQRYRIEPHRTVAELLREVARADDEARLREEYYGWNESFLERLPALEYLEFPEAWRAGTLQIAVQSLDLNWDASRIKLSVLHRPDGATAHLWFDQTYFEPRDCRRLSDCFVTLLQALASDANCRMGDLPIASVAEIESEVQAASTPGTAREVLPAERLFEICAEQNGDEAAVAWSTESLSYRELNARSNRLANRLRRLGSKADQIIAVMLRDSANVPLAFLAVLKSGAAYLPLDPDFPAPRVRSCLESAASSIVIVDDGFRLDDTFPHLTVVNVTSPDLADESSENLQLDIPGHALAYVIYTSGSTGTPKGVMVTRENLACSIKARLDYYGRWTRFVLLSPAIFDSSAAGIYGTLCSGGTLLLPSRETREDMRALFDFMKRERATHTLMVPSFYAAMLAEANLDQVKPAMLRGVIVAGEACPRDLVERHFDKFPEAALFNEYGPTEGTVWATVARLESTNTETGVSIGRAIPGGRSLLLDATLSPRPAGTVGEVFIGGPAVARGYLKQPSATASRFLPDPFTPGGRLYRTGDLAWRRPDSELVFMGRRDDQLKINGQRIEPGEIEAALRRIAGVNSAAVVAPQAENGTRVLVACVEGSTVPPVQELTKELRRNLPENLIPKCFVIVPFLPRTVTGKVDRAACTTLAHSEIKQNGGRAPETAVEVGLASIWNELLKVQAIGANEDFFALGGHSLLAMQLLARVRERYGCEIRLVQLFEQPTIEGLARLIEQARREDTAETGGLEFQPDPAARFDPFPLNSIQEAYWVGRKEGFELGNVGSTNYFEFEVPGLDLARFTSALHALIERHDMLRATIHADGFQQVAEHVPPYNIDTIDVRRFPEEQRTRSIERVRARMSAQSLPTDRWPLFEIVAHVLPGSVRLHISTELVVCDAVSSRILMRDLFRLYSKPEPLPALDLRFRDYVMADRAVRNGPRFERARAYWLDKLQSLSAAPELPLAKDPRQITAPHFTTLKHELSDRTWSELKRRAGIAGVAPTAVLCGAYARTLAMWAHSPRFTLNLTTYNRRPVHPQVHDLVGDFTSLTLIEVECRASSFTEHVRRVQQEIWNNLEHGQFGAVDIIREMRRVRGTGARAMLPVVFTSQLGTGGRDDREARTWLGTLAYSTGQAPQVWIDHQVAEPQGRLQFWWDYLGDLFPKGLVEEIFRHYCDYLEELASNEDCWTDERKVSKTIASATADNNPATEHTSLLFPGNLIHAGFLRQAEQRSTAPAVIWEDDTGKVLALDYAGLWEWSRRVATWVQEQRTAIPKGEQIFVAVILPKGWAQIAAVLGVTWAGAAYLPIDASWPGARVDEVLHQTGCRLIITHREKIRPERQDAQVATLILEDWLKDETPQAVAAQWLSQEEASSSAEKRRKIDLGTARPSDLAYVIYTSGSTGKPKGVMMDHGAVCLTLAEVLRRWRIGPADRVLAVSALGFDLSVFDIFGMLAAGGAIVLPNEAQRRDPLAWARLLSTQNVTIWNSVPALMEMALEHMDGMPAEAQWPGPLRLAMLSGDRIATAIPQRLRKRAPDSLLVSLGGATEAAIWSIAHEINEPETVIAEWHSVPYGKALAGQTVQVLRGEDTVGRRHLEPCPDWVTGRIYIGGGGLARGYWGNPEETERRFVVNELTGERLYDTGDLGRMLPGGTIEILGRVDQQVKIRGFRVELGEIESTLLKHPAVAAAAVRLVEGEAGKNKYLAAYVVPKREPHKETEPAAPRPDLEHWLGAVQSMLDRPGLRRLPETVQTLPLGSAVADSAPEARSAFRKRRTSRSFDAGKTVTVEQLGRWLECLRERADGENFQREYPSAGSLYPVQSYLWAKPNAIDGLAGGLYYYDPNQHQLALLNEELTLVRELYDPVNRGIFDRASFSIFLIGKLSAATPLYDQAARDFCLVEAGCMTQLLMMNATFHEIGLCPIGGLAFDRIRGAFAFDEEHVLLHSLLGGALISTRQPESRTAVVPPASEQDWLKDLVAFTREALPDYLVPARYVVLDSLPLSANGKIDRSQLPDPLPVGGRQTGRAPASGVETAVAQMWMELLNLPDVRSSDNFFALGGDSISSVRFLNRVRERFHIELSLREFFGAAELENVAEAIQRIVVERVSGMDEQAVEELLATRQ